MRNDLAPPPPRDDGPRPIRILIPLLSRTASPPQSEERPPRSARGSRPVRAVGGTSASETFAAVATAAAAVTPFRIRFALLEAMRMPMPISGPLPSDSIDVAEIITEPKSVSAR